MILVLKYGDWQIGEYEQLYIPHRIIRIQNTSGISYLILKFKLPVYAKAKKKEKD